MLHLSLITRPTCTLLSVCPLPASLLPSYLLPLLPSYLPSLLPFYLPSLLPYYLPSLLSV